MRNSRWARPAVRLALLYIIVNLPFMVLAPELKGRRGLMDLDYLLVPALSIASAPRALVGAVFVVLHGADLIRAFAPIFNFGLSDALASLGEVTIRPNGGVILMGGAFLAWMVASASSAAALFRNRFAQPSVASLAVLSALVVVADVVGRPEAGLWSRLTGLPGTNVAYSGLGAVGSAVWADIRDGKFNAELRVAVPDASTDELRQRVASGAAPERILLVMVESLGLPASPEVRQELFAGFAKDPIGTRYVRRTGAVPFVGATTSGELRELCSVTATHRTVLRIDHSGCLPAILASQGYRTVSVHGNEPFVFDRDKWYGPIGFRSQLWSRDLPVEHCGSIVRGSCDEPVANIVAKLVQDAADTRRFVYWLTLSTHWPVDADYGKGRFPCVVARLSPESDACAVLGGLRRTLDAVAAVALRAEEHPPYILVVGDHPPPPLGRQVSSLFVADSVPFIELTPRTLSSRAESAHDR